jgi:peptidoglycan/LPS O-acetylase OafA/YrhL
MSTQNQLGYRRDIQVLRGIAIIAVVGYHLRVPGFNNGFLGVDLFFVISGYLMAAIYPKGQVKDFYLRRAKRLLPAFIATIILTVLLCYFLVVPSDLIQVIQQSKFSLVLAPNFYFWSQDSYFSQSNFNPLLHLWSLGVEFQFYMILPMLIWLFSKSRINQYLITSLSIVGCFLVLSISPKTSFFLLPFRIWEFVAGIAALGLLKKKIGPKAIHSRRIVGILLTVFGLLVFFWFPTDGFSTSTINGHPGFASLVVTILGFTYLVLAPKLKTGVCLETLGTYSYSIYLVHFPLIVLLQYKPFSGTNFANQPFLNLIIQVFLIGLFSFLMYSFIEKPIRRNNFRFKFWVLFLLTSFVLISTIPSIKLLQLNDAERSIVESRFDRSEYRCGKISRIINPSSKVCVVGSGAYQRKILLLGNSHADAIKESFAKAANTNGKTVFFWVQNNPLMNSLNDSLEIQKQVEINNILEVHIHYSLGAVNLDVLTSFIKQIGSQGVLVTIIGPVPTWEKSVPEELWSNRNSTNKSINLSQTIEEFNERNSNVLSALRSKLPLSVQFYDVGKILCTPLCQYQDAVGALYYWDSGHLTLSGAKVLYPVFLQATRS